MTTVSGETVRAFVPAPLPPAPPLDLGNGLQRALEAATPALGRLDGASTLLPDTGSSSRSCSAMPACCVSRCST